MFEPTPRTAATAAIAIIAAVAGTAVSAQHSFAPGSGVTLTELDTLSGSIRFDLPEGRVVLWEEADDAGHLVPHWAFSRDGRSIDRAARAPRTVALFAGAFDPLEAEQPRLDALDVRGSGGLRLVQLAIPTMQSLRDGVEQAGGRIVGYLPEGTFIVHADERSAHAIEALPFVRWVGDYLPSYRLEPALRDAFAAGAAPGEQRYSILLVQRGPAAHDSVNRSIEALGGVVELPGTMGRRLEATLNADQLAALAAHPLVEFIDRAGPPEEDMDIVREFGGANYVEQMGGFTGTGVRGEVMDGGLRVTHMDFRAIPPIIHNGNVGSASHGTSVYGIVFGDGTANPSYRGMIPDAQGIFSDYELLGDRYQHTSRLLQPPYEAVFQTNSWGNPRTFLYTSISADMDDILFDLDFTITQSQSNAGNQDSRPQAWAKNIVSVGGVVHGNTLTRNDDRWSASGSVGPAADGRIKPDLTHFYDATRTTSSSNDTAYADFGGTSGATPITIGHFGLMFEMWGAGLFGNDVGGGSVFEERPAATTAKALMINSASPYHAESAADDFGRYRQGWGTADVRRLFDRRGSTFVVDETDVIGPMQAATYQLLVPGGEDLRVTMVFADPAGNPAADRAIVNDLSLRVTSPSGDVYWGNHGLLDANESTPGGQSDSINNVENVWVNAAEAGTWLVEVIAHAINQDGHRETPELDADFALVASGVVGHGAGDVAIRLSGGLPGNAVPREATPLEVQVIAPSVPDRVELNAAVGAGPFQSIAMAHVSSEGDVHTYAGALPAGACAEPFIHFWVEAEAGGEVATSPAEAGSSYYEVPVRLDEVVLEDTFASAGDWTVQNVNISSGVWQHAFSGDGSRADPRMDYDGNDRLFLTDSGSGRDVDGGPTRLVSPVLDLSALSDPHIGFAWFLNVNNAGTSGEDVLVVEVSPDAGGNWLPVAQLRPAFVWREQTFRVRDYTEPTSATRVRFSIEDNPNNSHTEAAIDTFRVIDRGCGGCPADMDGDGVLDVGDFFTFLDYFAAGDRRADINNDGRFDVSDFFAYLDLFAAGCD